MKQKHALRLALVASIAMHVAGAVWVHWWNSHRTDAPIELSGKVIPEPINIDFAEMAKSASRRVVKHQASVKSLPVSQNTQTTDVPPAPTNDQPTQSNDLEAVDGSMDGEGEVDPSGKRRITFEQYVRWVRSHNPAIEYPRMARLSGDQGKVVLIVAIASTGSPPRSVRVESSSGSALLDGAAQDAVSKWRFPPFRGRDELILRIPYRFVLD